MYRQSSPPLSSTGGTKRPTSRTPDARVYHGPRGSSLSPTPPPTSGGWLRGGGGKQDLSPRAYRALHRRTIPVPPVDGFMVLNVLLREGPNCPSLTRRPEGRPKIEAQGSCLREREGSSGPPVSEGVLARPGVPTGPSWSRGSGPGLWDSWPARFPSAPQPPEAMDARPGEPGP